MQKWEYKETTSLNEFNLKILGQEGWELVCVAITDTTAQFATAFFKRPLK